MGSVEHRTSNGEPRAERADTSMFDVRCPSKLPAPVRMRQKENAGRQFRLAAKPFQTFTPNMEGIRRFRCWPGRKALIWFLAFIPCSAANAAALPDPTALEQNPPRTYRGPALPEPHQVGPALPGLKQGAVPQGVAFVEKPGWWLVSFYFDTKFPSMVAVIDFKTGRIIKTLSQIGRASCRERV